MKYREILLEQLKSLPYFNKATVYQISKQYELKETTVDTYISRSLTRKDLLQLKKGTYVTTDFYEKNRGDISYVFYLANALRTPSYVSTWTALQYYDLATEAIKDTIASVTPKITRTYHSRAGHFSYHSIKEEFFTGFTIVKGKFNFFLASPSKALFDLLYFRTKQFRGIRINMIDDIVNELRVDFDEMDTKEREKFYRSIEDFFKHYG